MGRPGSGSGGFGGLSFVRNRHPPPQRFAEIGPMPIVFGRSGWLVTFQGCVWTDRVWMMRKYNAIAMLVLAAVLSAWLG
jgi:hypothetical protein